MLQVSTTASERLFIVDEGVACVGFYISFLRAFPAQCQLLFSGCSSDAVKRNKSSSSISSLCRFKRKHLNDRSVQLKSVGTANHKRLLSPA